MSMNCSLHLENEVRNPIFKIEHYNRPEYGGTFLTLYISPSPESPESVTIFTNKDQLMNLAATIISFFEENNVSNSENS